MRILTQTDKKPAVLEKELRDLIDADRYFLSPRVQTLRDILHRIRPEPVPTPYRLPVVMSRHVGVGISDVEGRRIGEIPSLRYRRRDQSRCAGWVRTPGRANHLASWWGHRGSGSKVHFVERNDRSVTICRN